MLTEKDYCDYDTCVALKELGYKVPTSAYYMPKNSQLIFVINQFRGGAAMDCFYSNNSLPKECMASDFIDAPTMWEVQKWLREEKKIDVMVIRDYWCNTKYNPYCRHYFPKLYRKYGSFEKTEIVGEVPTYDSYEEALSEGIKCAVKILKENETIHE